MTNIETTAIDADNEHDDDKIAIIGLAGRFPGAETISAFWDNLEQGREVKRSSTSSGERVFASFSLDNSLCFDAEFFGLSPSEAAMMDPQHRVFLETAWQAMDDAGYSKGTDPQVTGVFAAAGFNDYVLKHIGPLSYTDSSAEYFAMMLGNDKDFLASRTAYSLDLRGPATVVQSACSSGLLAVHQGIQSLLQGEVDIALTGAVSICLDLENGYLADKGGPMSPTGVIAPFSEQSNGIVGGNGVAALVLKRYCDAVDDHDHIYAVVHASAVNNDGADRASFTSPSVIGQKKVLAQALHLSGLTPSDIRYIEAHGTGTPLGDPIEFDAIKQIYGAADNDCFVGSVKGNVGHLNTVSGLAGLIKTIGVMYRQVIPPMMNFKKSNPLLEIEKTRFHINNKAKIMAAGTGYAGLSSFGFGGTNVHLIIGSHEAGKIKKPDVSEDEKGSLQPQLCLLSAKTTPALQRMKQALSQIDSTVDIVDYAATLLHGRASFNQRCALIASNVKQASHCLSQNKLIDNKNLPDKAELAPIFLFSGQGNQYAGMGSWLYQHRDAYRQIVDHCSDILQPLINEDLRTRLFSESNDALLPTRYTQLALFITEYASARLLIDVGIKPALLLGHSIGEYVAACIAGVFSLEDALNLVNERGRLIEQLPSSAMLLVSLSVDHLAPYINHTDLSLAVINPCDRCVVSGDHDAINRLTQQLEAVDISCHPLSVSHGFHSHLLEPMLDEFNQACQKISYGEAQYPILSNSSGSLADPEQIMTADYWVKHLRQTVRFDDNIQYLSEHWSGHLCLDLSPGNSMKSMLSQYESLKVLPLMSSLNYQASDFLSLLGNLWVAGHTEIEPLVIAEQLWQRIPLPTYPFERQIHVLPTYQEQPAPVNVALSQNETEQSDKPDLKHISYIPSWYPRAINNEKTTLAPLHRIYFINDNQEITPEPGLTIVRCAQQFSTHNDGSISLNPTSTDDFNQLLSFLKAIDIEQIHCDYAWCVDGDDSDFSVKQRGYDGLCRLSQTLINAQVVTSLTLMTQNLCLIQGDEQGDNEQALAVGLLRTLPLEYGEIKLTWLDTDQLPTCKKQCEIKQIRDHSTQRLALILGLRQNNVLERGLSEFSLAASTGSDVEDQASLQEKNIKQGGSYLLVGGMGRLGLILAKALSKQKCQLIIMGRNITPELQTTPQSHPDLAYCIEQGTQINLLIQSADNHDDMAAFVAHCQQDGTVVDGVFNLAGRYTKQLIQDISLQESDTNYRAKVKTTQALHQLLSPLKPEFLVNFSSLAAELPGYGNCDYMAANFYQNMVAQKTPTTFPVITIAWDNWQGFGQVNNNKTDQDLFTHQGTETLNDEQGIEMLWRIMSSDHRHVIVSLKPPAYYQQQIESSIASSAEDFIDLMTETPPTSASSSEKINKNTQQTPTQAVCMTLFQEMLGVDNLDLDDDFLERGGDSIMAIRLVSRLEKIFQTEISLPDFIGNQTVRLFADYLAEVEDNTRTAEAYLHLQRLSLNNGNN